MSDPLSYQLLAAVKACIEQISVAAGFYTDLGQHVTNEPYQLLADAPATVAVIYSGSKPDPQDMRNREIVSISVLVQLPVGDPLTTELQLHRALADVSRALTGQQKQFPAGASTPAYAGTVRLEPKEGVNWIGAHVRYESHLPRPR